MTSTVQRIEGPGDAELIAAVREGDTEAYGVLFERHVEAARRLARQLAPGPDADDLVAEAFAKVLVVLQRGGGPDLAFRAYLLTAVRRLHVDRIRFAHRVHATDDLTLFLPGVPFHDTAVEAFESDAVARAFASLPERWQLVLWHTEVEGHKPAEIAPLLAMSANSVSALAYRAREGLRQAFLSMHAGDPADDTCVATRACLGSFVRGALSRRDATRVEDHLSRCRPCAGVHLELTRINTELGGVLAPALLGTAGSAYLATYAAVGSTGSAVTGGVVVSLLDRVRDVVGAHAVSTSVAGAAATVALGGAVIVGLGPDTAPIPVTDPPARATLAPEPRPRSQPTTPERPAPSIAAPTVTPRTPQPRTPADAPPSRTEVEHRTTPLPAPPAQPTPAPTAPPSVPLGGDHDLSLSATTEGSGPGLTRVTVSVSGLPAGRTATLTTRSEGLVVARAVDAACQDLGSTMRCAVEPAVASAATSFVFLAHTTDSGAMSFHVLLDGEGTDTRPADNHASVSVS